ncbi:hypothetical protein FFWV33_11550 [Flavobacterium faecale]|uniref:Carboxypeptidase regulatory-like domain-containing protein n=1 Tax=Flavobacterium faecale TaxID=1355330 RepID=A0A2S1LEH6_9FLAO|nr:hypothetical protein [Flavobacterium faecale]AWG22099.1 hypothetical protein FFWV33_11550 [Flavobacterium faecale]
MKKIFNNLKIVFLFFLSVNLYANVQNRNTTESPFSIENKDTIVIKGKINYFFNGGKASGAQVAFITLDKVYFSNRTTKNGRYQIKVPSEKVFKKNVIFINYSSNFYLFKFDYHIIGSRFSKTKRLEVGVDNVSKFSRVNPNEDDLVYVEGKQKNISSLYQFDLENKHMQYVIEDREIIKNLCGETSKKRLILYFLWDKYDL